MRTIVWAMVCLLVGCGGGGSGGGGGGGSSSPSNTGTLSLSMSSLTFTTGSPSYTPSDQPVTATLTGEISGTVYIRVVLAGTAVADVRDITISGNSGFARVVPANATVLGPGVHTGTITVTACTSNEQCLSGIIGSPQTINVTYTVPGLVPSTPGLQFTLGTSPTTADYTRTFTLTTHPAYTATTDVNWLTVTPTTGGSGSRQITVNLLQAQVDAFDSGAHNATITLVADVFDSPVRIPVTLTVMKPQLKHVGPYVVEAGTSDRVIVRGRYLDGVSVQNIDLATTLNGTGIAPLSITPVGSTELHLTYPALLEGSYLVRLRNAHGAVASTTRLVAVDTPAYAAEAIELPEDPRYRLMQSVLYDAERRALVMSYCCGMRDITEQALLRVAYDTGWGTPNIVVIPYLDRVALSADGQHIIAGSQGTLTLHHPVSLTEQRSVQSFTSGSRVGGLGVTNTNQVIIGGEPATSSGGLFAIRYSIDTEALDTISEPQSHHDLNTSVATSGDGSRVVVAGMSGERRIYDYVPSDYEVLPTRVTSTDFGAQLMALDKRGSTLLAWGAGQTSQVLRVYDRNWNVRGEIPSDAAFALAPDGSRAYTYRINERLVRVYDLTATPVAGAFPQVGDGITPVAVPDEDAGYVSMTITPDGRTLFLVGDARIVVVPVP